MSAGHLTGCMLCSMCGVHESLIVVLLRCAGRCCAWVFYSSKLGCLQALLRPQRQQQRQQHQVLVQPLFGMASLPNGWHLQLLQAQAQPA